MEQQPPRYDPEADADMFMAWKNLRAAEVLDGAPTIDELLEALRTGQILPNVPPAAESLAAMQEITDTAEETATRMWLHDVETPEDL